MEGFWDFVSVVVIVNAVLLAIFLVLLALPQSRLGRIFFRILGILNYIVAGLLIIYVISPIDIISDIVPVLGQTDDAAGIVGVIIDGIIGYISLRKSREELPETPQKESSVDN